jgi:hypothetical protein
MGRAWLNYKRNPQLLFSKIFATAFFAIFVSILYWRIAEKDVPTSTSPEGQISAYIGNIAGLMFFVGTGMIFSALGPLVTICNCC